MFENVLKTSDDSKKAWTKRSKSKSSALDTGFTVKADIGVATPKQDSRAVPGNGFDPKNFKEPPKTGFNILFDESMGHNQKRLPKAVAPARATKSEAPAITNPVMAGSLQATLGMR